MINNSVMKCCICNNEKMGEFITINDNKYHLCCIEKLQQENNQLKEQRKELRSWLEDEIKEIERHTTTLDIFNTYDYETIHEMETTKITYKMFYQS